ncbi:MAG: hypothetical protein Q8N03_14295 [Ignavibacteria bacterium]|nr:hypothetical protein [Ignavibacteria bacterium]
MKQLVRIFILPSSPLFNLDKLKPFENFSPIFSSMLYTTSYSNLIEVFSNPGYDLGVYPLLHFYDDGLIEDEFIPTDIISNLKLVDSERLNISKLFHGLDFQNNISIFTFSDTIGYNKQTIYKMVELLKNEDDVLVMARNNNGSITHFGMNGRPIYFFSISEMSDLDSALKSELALNRFIYLLEGINPIRTFSDFKELYRLLSIKENFYFCSLEIHKQFNNLFIEFKEMLK